MTIHLSPYWATKTHTQRLPQTKTSLNYIFTIENTKHLWNLLSSLHLIIITWADFHSYIGYRILSKQCISPEAHIPYAIVLTVRDHCIVSATTWTFKQYQRLKKSKFQKIRGEIILGGFRVLVLDIEPWRGTKGPKLKRKPGNGKPVLLGPLHYKKDTWPALAIATFGTLVPNLCYRYNLV